MTRIDRWCRGLAIASLLIAMSSSATLIDLGVVTRDTDTGLDWLDLTESGGIGYDGVAFGFGGFLADGWQIANEAQVCDLLSNHGVPMASCPALPAISSLETRTLP